MTVTAFGLTALFAMVIVAHGGSDGLSAPSRRSRRRPAWPPRRQRSHHVSLKELPRDIEAHIPVVAVRAPWASCRIVVPKYSRSSAGRRVAGALLDGE
jgi:hypothetical protein